MTTNGETDWMAFAECRTAELKLFITKSDDDPEDPYPTKDALEYCDRCPVRTECLNDALTNNWDGIWGGLTEYQRRQIKRRYSRDVCPSCTSNLIVTQNRNELCLSCGTSWWAS